MLNNVRCWASDLICMCLFVMHFRGEHVLHSVRGARFILPSFIHTWLLCCAHGLFPALLMLGLDGEPLWGEEEWQEPPWHLSWLSPGHSLPSWNGASTSSCSHQIVTGALASSQGLLQGLPDPQFWLVHCVCARVQFLCKLIGLSVTASNISDLSWVQ